MELIDQSSSPYTVLPSSKLYELLDTPFSGRGVFASTDIPAGTPILSTSLGKSKNISSTSTLPDPTSRYVDSSPIAWNIQRPYRKEACANCFAYNRGREWKVKVEDYDCGIVFCSPSCRDAWLDRNGDVGAQAWEALESSVKTMLKRNANGRYDDMYDDADYYDADDIGLGGTSRQRGPSEKEIYLEWEKADLWGQVALNARTKLSPSKTEKRVLRNIIDMGGDPDLMYYFVTAVIGAYNAAQTLQKRETEEVHEPSQQPIDITQSTEAILSESIERLTISSTQSISNSVFDSTSNSAASTCPSSPADSVLSQSTSSTKPITTLLAPLFTLTPTLSGYSTPQSSIQLYTTSYLFLLAHLPLSLTPYLTTTLVHNLNTRASHNAFSIRPTSHSQQGTCDGPDSGEYLGFAVYPSASFFNHSCSPNLVKHRAGRDWHFTTARDITRGEELCITYLGGEEESLGLRERRRRLKDEWGFWCRCGKCVGEEIEVKWAKVVRRVDELRSSGDVEWIGDRDWGSR